MFNLEKGSCFGLSHTFTQLGYMRPHNQHATINNLFFVGCSTHPGSGLPNVLVSLKTKILKFRSIDFEYLDVFCCFTGLTRSTLHIPHTLHPTTIETEKCRLETSRITNCQSNPERFLSFTASRCQQG
jgi:hypothetical protein